MSSSEDCGVHGSNANLSLLSNLPILCLNVLKIWSHSGEKPLFPIGVNGCITENTDTDDVRNGTTDQLWPCHLDLTAINSDSVHGLSLTIDRNTAGIIKRQQHHIPLTDYINDEFQRIWNNTTSKNNLTPLWGIRGLKENFWVMLVWLLCSWNQIKGEHQLNTISAELLCDSSHMVSTCRHKHHNREHIENRLSTIQQGETGSENGQYKRVNLNGFCFQPFQYMFNICKGKNRF